MTVDHASTHQDANHRSASSSHPVAQVPRPSKYALASLTLVTVIAIVAGLLGPSPASGHEEDDDTATTSSVSGEAPEITFPVVGPSSFVDTYGACRGAGCSRSHEGVDIFALKLAPLVAVEDGVITGIRRSGLGLGGNLIALTGDSGWRYLYIHVNNDSPGTDDGANPQGWVTANRLRVGSRVSAGDVLGYLGDSGNAEETPPHVHFEIHEPGVGVINPTGMVAEARSAGRVISVASLASTPEGRAESTETIISWYQALLDRDPTDEELFAWTDRFDVGLGNENDLIADLTMAKPRRDLAGDVVRAFYVTLGRRPSLNEIRQWEAALVDGLDLATMSQILVDSGPFDDRFGPMSDEEFINAVFQAGLGRAAEAEEMSDWLGQLAGDAGRGDVAAFVADSFTVKNDTWRTLEVIQAYRAGLDRMPTDDEFDLWLAHLDAGGLIPDVVEGIRTATEPAVEAEPDTAEAEATSSDDTEPVAGVEAGTTETEDVDAEISDAVDAVDTETETEPADVDDVEDVDNVEDVEDVEDADDSAEPGSDPATTSSVAGAETATLTPLSDQDSSG